MFALTLLVGGWGVAPAKVFAKDRDSAAAVTRIIDGEINQALAAKKIQPAPRAADVELVRRLYLDLLGRIPTAAEAAEFLENNSPDKHHSLIARLLAHEEMPVYWRGVFWEWFSNGLLEPPAGGEDFQNYLQQSLAQNRPWNEMARDLLVPDFTDPLRRNAAFFLTVRLNGPDKQTKIDNMTTAVASLLFGVQLQCAKCHDHPFVATWKQDHYYGLAAYFGRTETTKVGNASALAEKADGEVTFVTTKQEQKTARPMFLDGHAPEEPKLPSEKSQWYSKVDGQPDRPFFSRRGALADYALRPESAFFKRAIVNRLWKQFLGRGLVEPVDQMHDANPATHPALLARLSDDFATSGFDLRRLIAGIVSSDAYLRTSRWPSDQDRPADHDYAVALLKPLSPEQLATSVGVATGHFELARAKFEREKKNRKVDEITPAVARLFYSRERDTQDFANRFRSNGEGFEAHAGQALFLTYNNLMVKQLDPIAGNLVDRLVQEKDNSIAIRVAFETILTRLPTDEELARCSDFLSASQPARATLCRELAWALIGSSEFRFNH